MTPSELESLFSELAVPSPGSLTARPLEFGSGRYRVARQGDGAPALLVYIDEIGEPPSGEQLANLSYLPRARLRVESAEGSIEEAVYSVLTCRSPDTELRHYFFRVVAALIDELGASPDVATIDSALARLLELFRALERPGSRSVQGLWAELLVIKLSPDPALGVAAWHAEPEAVHDFAAGSDRLEVKGTTRSIRQHHFRLEQLAPPPEGRLLVASLMLTRTEGGLTVPELVQQVFALLPDATEHRARLEAVVAASLGNDWRLVSGVGFDEQAAQASLRFYESTDVPSVDPNTPLGVSEVRFLVDLSAIPQPQGDLRGASQLFHAMLPAPAGDPSA